MMTSFSYSGGISASKSIYNRALIIKSHFSELNIYGDSQCDDVLHMKNAVNDFNSGNNEIYCGEAGTVFRFMALRVAREKGEYLLKGSKKLYSRLPNDLVQLLGQLGCEASFSEDGLLIKSVGWKIMGDALHLQSKNSSQFASSTFLNAWNYPLDLFITVPKSMASTSYFKLSLDMLSELGMTIFSKGTEFHVPKNQKISMSSYVCETDASSCFAIAAAAVLNGQVQINNFVENSLQPDTYFLNIMEMMGIKFSLEDTYASFLKQKEFYGLEVNLNDNPDLFPVLAVLCSFAEGESYLFGVTHLAHKESDRFNNTIKLLKLAGVKAYIKDDGIVIGGEPNLQAKDFSFDACNDHRMAMAAGLFKLKGFNIKLSGKGSVSKSFPEFWDILDL